MLRSAFTLLKNTVKDMREDRIVGVAAEVAFFALLAIGPLLVVLAAGVGAVTGLLGGTLREDIAVAVTDALGGLVSAEVATDFVQPIVDGVFGGEARGGVLSIGLLLALWSSSRLVKVMIEALNIAYDVEDWRSAWKRRLIALGLTLGGILALLVFLPFVVAGPRLGAAIDDWAHLNGVLDTIWPVIYWPIAAMGGIAILASLYHVAPNWHTPWRRELPGAALAAVVWVAAAFGLRVYVTVAVTDTAFGPLAAPIVLMLWLYVTAFGVLLGAELNAEIEKMWPTPDAHPKVARFATAAKAGARRVAERMRTARTHDDDDVALPSADEEPDASR